MANPLDALKDTGDTPDTNDISGMLIKRAQAMMPERSDIASKREGLLNAYSKLMQAQQYRAPSVRDPGMMAQAIAQMQAPWGSNPEIIQSLGLKAKMDTNDALIKARQGADVDAAKTGVAQQDAGVGFLGTDETNADKLLSQAGTMQLKNELQKIREQSAQDKLWKTVKTPSGGIIAVNPSTGEQKVIQAGSDDPSDQNDKLLNAKQYGVPLANPSIDPTKGMTPTGKSSYVNRITKQLDTESSQAQEIEKHMNDVDQFLQTNQQAKTGFWRNIPPVAAVLSAASPDFQTMLSQNKNLALANRPANMRITQSEFNVFRQAAVSPTNTVEANENIGNATKAFLQRQKDFIDFKSDYALVNGHLEGAKQAFDEYMKKNPIFSPDASPKNHFALNPNRQSYQQYFAKKYGWDADQSDATNAAPAAPAPQASAAPPSAMPPDLAAALAKRKLSPP